MNQQMTSKANISKQNSIWIVIVNWNQANLTEACIKSFLGRQEKFGFSLLVIDNGSEDKSVSYLRDKFPEIELVCLPKNLGFAGGYNYGIRKAFIAGAEYILIVNNDTVADIMLVENLLNKSKAIQADLSSPIIYYMGSNNKVWSAGGMINPILCAPIFSHSRHKKTPDKPVKRDFISGCAMLIHRNVIETIGYFDENYFLYYEDLDYCIRAKKAGLQTYVIPSAKLWHHVSASSKGTNSPEESYWMSFSSQRYYKKHVRGLRWLAVGPWRFLHLIKTWLSLVLRGKFDAARAFVNGMMDGLKSS